QISQILTEFVDVFRKKQEFSTRVNTKEILQIELNLKGKMKDNEMKKIAIDYRMLNKYLEQYREPLPDSKQILQK
ncbi:14855_t:CDS:2, partial [Cetraspora pellucida]